MTVIDLSELEAVEETTLQGGAGITGGLFCGLACGGLVCGLGCGYM